MRNWSMNDPQARDHKSHPEIRKPQTLHHTNTYATAPNYNTQPHTTIETSKQRPNFDTSHHKIHPEIRKPHTPHYINTYVTAPNYNTQPHATIETGKQRPNFDTSHHKNSPGNKKAPNTTLHKHLRNNLEQQYTAPYDNRS